MSDKKQRPPAKPRWWKNTYFLFGIILAVLGLLGLLRGAPYIMDPGQPYDAALPWLYLLAALIFFANGYVSHSGTVEEYAKSLEGENA